MIPTHPRPAPATSRAICVIALALIVTGCTGNFIYNRLDTLASWYLGSLVSLDGGQRSQLQDWLTQTLAWHRQSELSRYSQFLRDLSGEFSEPGTLADYAQKQQRFEAFWGDLAARISPDATRLLMSLSPAQVDELIGNMAQKSRDRAEDNADADDWRRDQTRGLTRQVKRWTGSVSGQQKQLIAAAVAQLEPTQAQWLASQYNWQEALHQSLRDAASTCVQDLLMKPQIQWTEQYSQTESRNRQRYLELVASLDAELTLQQRARLRAELLKLAQQLDDIAQAGKL